MESAQVREPVKVQVGEYLVELSYNKKSQWGTYKWDFELYKNGEHIGGGCDFHASTRGKEKTAQEIIHEYEHGPEDEDD